MQIGHIRTSASCAHLIRLDWQTVYIAQFDNAAPHDANHRRYRVAVVRKCVVSNGGVVRGHEREWTTYFRGSATTCWWAQSGITIQNALTMKTTTFIHTSS